MSNIYYMLTFTIMFSLVVLLVFTIRSFMLTNDAYYGVSFVSINKNYQIDTLDNIDYDSENIIFVKNIPQSCIDDSNHSIYCLSDLKKKGGFYNGKWFKGEDVGSINNNSCNIIVENGESIQTAIDKAKEDYVICLKSGNYEGDLEITKEGIVLISIGEDNVQIEGDIVLSGVDEDDFKIINISNNSCDITVENGESIQTAIDDAQEDYVICVKSGTYKENLEIDKKGIALIGVGTDRSILDGTDINEHGIYIYNFDNIEIKNIE
ncbi:putative pectinesterase, partial [Candidatus Vampirococcus lugosii]